MGKASPKGFSASKCEVGSWIFSKLGIFEKFFGFFWDFFWDFFFLDFLGEIFLKDFFWGGFFLGIFWKDFFGRNAFVKVLSQCRRKENFNS